MKATQKRSLALFGTYAFLASIATAAPVFPPEEEEGENQKKLFDDLAVAYSGEGKKNAQDPEELDWPDDTTTNPNDFELDDEEDSIFENNLSSSEQTETTTEVDSAINDEDEDVFDSGASNQLDVDETESAVGETTGQPVQNGKPSELTETPNNGKDVAETSEPVNVVGEPKSPVTKGDEAEVVPEMDDDSTEDIYDNDPPAEVTPELINWDTTEGNGQENGMTTDQEDEATLDEEEATLEEDETTLEEEEATLEEEEATLEEEEATLEEEEATLEEEEATLEEEEANLDEEEANLDEEANLQEAETNLEDGEANIEDDETTLEDEETSLDDEETNLDEEANLQEVETKLETENNEISQTEHTGLENQGEPNTIPAIDDTQDTLKNPWENEAPNAFPGIDQHNGNQVGQGGQYTNTNGLPSSADDAVAGSDLTNVLIICVIILVILRLPRIRAYLRSSRSTEKEELPFRFDLSHSERQTRYKNDGFDKLA